MDVFKGVVRDMGSKSENGKKMNRYLVMGLIVTDQKINMKKGDKGDLVVGGDAEGLLNALFVMPSGKPKESIFGLSADQTLLMLREI